MVYKYVQKPSYNNSSYRTMTFRTMMSFGLRVSPVLCETASVASSALSTGARFAVVLRQF